MRLAAKSLQLIYKVCQSRWVELLFLTLLILIYGGTRLITVSSQHDLIFDENYYIPRAQTAVTQHIETHPEYQPPLGILGIYAGIAVNGDTPIGWRLFSVIMGCIGLAAFYIICRQLKFSIVPSLISTIGMGMCSLYWWFSGHACLDIYMVSFSIVAMMLYLHKNHLTAGVFSGLAIASKIMGFLSTWTMIILDVWTNRGKRFVEIAGGAVVAFIGTIFTSELIMTHTFINPVAYIAHLTTYATAIKNLEDLPNAFIWFIKYKNELFVDGSTTGFWLPLWFLSVPLFVYAIYKAFHGSLPGKVITSWLVGFYLSWCVMAFVIGRGSYIYYQLMVVPCIYLALAFALNQIIQWSKERYGRKRLLSQR